MSAPHRPHLAAGDDATGPRRSLVLAGGGMRVSYQAGVLRAFEEAGLRFFHGDGASGGTINLAMLFSGLSPREMCDRWRRLKISDFVSFLPPRSYLKASERMAMGDADGVVDKVFPHLGIDVAKINAAEGIEGTFNVCNYSRKTDEAIPHRRVTIDLLVAGISLPIFMPPVPHDGSLYIDAVWIKDANVMEAVRRGAEEIWLVWCIGNTPEYKPGYFNQYVHMIEMSANGALFEEFDRVRELNRRIARGDSPFGQTAPIRLHVVKPPCPLPLDTDLYMGRITNQSLIQMGYADARRYLATMAEEGIPFESEATRMEVPKAGLTFRETMQGPFALDAMDPEEGKKKGQGEGTELALHGTVLIRDLDRFLDDPEHAGDLLGQIDFPPFGEAILGHGGVFNLFSPADQPGLKLMVYELAFEHDGTSYYLAGRKEVRDDPGLDLWSDTTTLFTRLHRGDRSGPVVGAGVLRLGVADLVRLMTTMRVTDARSAGDKLGGVTRFGRFFLGELWDTYVRHLPRDDGDDD